MYGRHSLIYGKSAAHTKQEVHFDTIEYYDAFAMILFPANQ